MGHAGAVSKRFTGQPGTWHLAPRSRLPDESLPMESGRVKVSVRVGTGDARDPHADRDQPRLRVGAVHSGRCERHGDQMR